MQRFVPAVAFYLWVAVRFTLGHVISSATVSLPLPIYLCHHTLLLSLSLPLSLYLSLVLSLSVFFGMTLYPPTSPSSIFLSLPLSLSFALTHSVLLLQEKTLTPKTCTQNQCVAHTQKEREREREKKRERASVERASHCFDFRVAARANDDLSLRRPYLMLTHT